VDSLAQEGYAVSLRLKSKDKLEATLFQDLDLLIIDAQKLSLDELSAYPLIRTVYTGLLMILIEGIDEMLQVLLYEQGVDELLIKPINHLLMLARIRALLRRKDNRAIPVNLVFNGLEINGGLRLASYHDQEIPLTAREFDLLWYLARNSCITLDRDHLYKAVFGIEYNGYDRSIDMYIARIRSKMAFHPGLPQMIKTVRGSGYLFAA
jgi:two-component system response regulator RstA